MNITPIFFNNFKYQITPNNNSYQSKEFIPKLNYNIQDTVSFTSKEKLVRKSGATIEDVLRRTYEADTLKYRAMGMNLMDTLEAIANKFKDSGVSFSRDYCQTAVVKGTDNFIDKFKRTGEKPYDRVRSTIFIENPYDFKLLKKIFDELDSRGLSIREYYEKINGKRVKKYDLSIRLGGVTEQDTKPLGAELQGYIDGPQKLGYEDIQMRLVDKFHSKKDTIPMEVIVLFGKEYAKCKKLESYYSYDIRRALNKLLHVSQIQSPKVNTPAYRIQNNVNIISDILGNCISKPLFLNGKNIDFCHDKMQIPVEISRTNMEVLQGLLNGIQSKIPIHYKSEIAKINSDEFKPELEKLVKASQQYKEREDKTIYVEDLNDVKKNLRKMLNSQKTEDLKTLTAVKARLMETFEMFGEKKSKS